MFVRIGGKQMYLWRAVDAEGEVLEMLVQARRDATAARKLMRKLLRKQGILLLPGSRTNIRLTARRFGICGSTAYPTCTPSGKTTGPRARTFRFGDASASLSMRAMTNSFNFCRQLTTARTHRLFRAEAFAAWRDAAGVAA